MAERADRTVGDLLAAEHAQKRVLAKTDQVDEIQMEAAKKQRMQAQASR